MQQLIGRFIKYKEQVGHLGIIKCNLHIGATSGYQCSTVNTGMPIPFPLKICSIPIGTRWYSKELDQSFATCLVGLESPI